MPRDTALSFEFFPPADEHAAAQLRATLARLACLQPRFVSVTHGAGGSARERTFDCVRRLRHDWPIDVMPHLAAAGATREEVRDLAARYRRAGVRRLLALRGDAPKQDRAPPAAVTAEYPYAADLVEDLAARGGFEVLVAAYPEGHPDTRTVAADVVNLARKVDAGATSAITQFFFDTDVYLAYRDRCGAAGIRIPIVPGMLPIRRFAQVERFAARCGAAVPCALRWRFDGVQGDGGFALATEVLMEQIQRLRAHGVDEFHFYTLNHADITEAACRALSLGAPVPVPVPHARAALP
ncbi:MAG TPA: methylenetetrahydrofolate reductase [Steroidobacteraceae bacterium]|nr:methylenetetrahydrofolate reductase [Steroidobacteraceae bacterium]